MFVNWPWCLIRTIYANKRELKPNTQNSFPCHKNYGANKAITIDSFQAIHQTIGNKNKAQLRYKQNNKAKGSWKLKLRKKCSQTIDGFKFFIYFFCQQSRHQGFLRCTEKLLRKALTKLYGCFWLISQLWIFKRFLKYFIIYQSFFKYIQHSLKKSGQGKSLSSS